MAFVLRTEIQNLAKDFGIERLGFLTLTFADRVVCIREAQKRFRSLCTHVLRLRYTRCIGVWERQKSGRIHFHLIVVNDSDIRTGFDFAGIANRDYHTASPAIRAEWAFWRKTAPKYGFGRTELLPVKSSADGIAFYVGKYVSKHVGQPTETDKGARCVRFIGYKPGQRRSSPRFSWNTQNSWLWRQKLASFCRVYRLKDTDAIKSKFGPRWAYNLQGIILAMEVGQDAVWPSETLERQEKGKADYREAFRDWRSWKRDRVEAIL